MKTKPTFYRQRLLLALLQSFDKKLFKLDLQKLLFLFVEEYGEQKKVYEFVPYHYGCYSFQANSDLKTMHNYGFLYLNETSNEIELIDNNTNYIDDLKERDKVSLYKFAQKYKDLSGNNLIAYVYENYPYYTMNSKIAHKFSIKPYEQQPTLFKENEKDFFTIGYEGVTFENYINKLIMNNIQTLCDVRKNAFSMKFGFSKNMLKHALEQVGIKYVHLPELGIESEDRKVLNTLEDYKTLFKEYETTTIHTDEAQTALEYLSNLSKNQNIALSCFEKDIKYCHRSVIANVLHNNYKLEYYNL